MQNTCRRVYVVRILYMSRVEWSSISLLSIFTLISFNTHCKLNTCAHENCCDMYMLINIGSCYSDLQNMCVYNVHVNVSFYSLHVNTLNLCVFFWLWVYIRCSCDCLCVNVFRRIYTVLRVLLLRLLLPPSMPLLDLLLY